MPVRVFHSVRHHHLTDPKTCSTVLVRTSHPPLLPEPLLYLERPPRLAPTLHAESLPHPGPLLLLEPLPPPEPLPRLELLPHLQLLPRAQLNLGETVLRHLALNPLLAVGPEHLLRFLLLGGHVLRVARREHDVVQRSQ